MTLHPQDGPLPHAEPGPLSEPFWTGCARGELLFQRCTDCGTPGFPPAELCRHCLSAALTWEKSAGRGTLYSWTVVHRPVTPAFTTPYAPAIVDLDEGYRFLTNLIDVAPDDIRAGMALRVLFTEPTPGLHLPCFAPP
jgi:uncharacterized OB-fold protein